MNTLEQTQFERFARIQRLIGRDGLDRLGRATVAVVGLGAVGSYAVEGLARAGVGRLRLVDFDVVRLSNINRQLYALESTLGESKARLARRRVLDINPACHVDAMECFAHEDTMDDILAEPVDLVIDAIDSRNPKVTLLAEARRRELPLVSSMGAALRTDPTAIRVGPIGETRNCPLARQVRKLLRRRDVPLDFPCVYSVETTDGLPDSAIAAPDESDPHEVDRGRSRRSLGSLPTVTGVFGLVLADTAIKRLLQPSPSRR